MSCPLASAPQAVPPPPDPLLSLSPKAAYDQASLPVEIVHRSIDNWSDSETAALAVAIAQAQRFCTARPPAQFTGIDLLDLAQLCALGQQWPVVLDASKRFLGASPPPTSGTPGSTAPSPRARALAFEVEASLYLRDPETAIAAGTTLLDTEPYTSLVQQSTDSLLRYIQLIQTGTAIDLSSKRLDRILPLLNASGKASNAPLSIPPNAVSAHDLYVAALATPILLQLENNTAAAAGVLATIESAVPARLSIDDTTLITLARRRYNLIGATLPHVPISASLLGSEPPRINRDFGAATILLIFPDWCAQCVRMTARDIAPFLARHSEDGVHLYALLAQAAPAPHPLSASAKIRAVQSSQSASFSTTQPAAVDALRGTPTLIVPASVPLSIFASTDFPLLVVTDHEGRIRFVGVAPDNAFVEGSLVDQLLARITDIWPYPTAH